MSTMVMPEDFLTRYSTTTDSCGCPSFQYSRDSHCKHIRVMNNPSSYHDTDAPRPPRQPLTDSYDTGKWCSFRASEFARNNGISYEAISSWKSRVGYFAGKISMHQLKNYLNYGSKRAVKLAERFAEGRDTFDKMHFNMNELRIECRLPTVDEDYRFDHRQFMMNTSVESCSCMVSRNNPEFYCKHTLKKRIDLGLYDGEESDIVFNEDYLTEKYEEQDLDISMYPVVETQVSSETQENIVLQPSETQEVSPIDRIINELSQLKNLEKQLSEQKAQLVKEQEEFREKNSCCNVCYEAKSINCCDTCSGQLCLDCWATLEDRKQEKCPYCRKQMKSLRNVLITKFKQFQM